MDNIFVSRNKNESQLKRYERNNLIATQRFKNKKRHSVHIFSSKSRNYHPNNSEEKNLSDNEDSNLCINCNHELKEHSHFSYESLYTCEDDQQKEHEEDHQIIEKSKGFRPLFKKLKQNKIEIRKKSIQDSVFGLKISVQQKQNKMFKPRFMKSSRKVVAPYSVFKRDQLIKRSLANPFKLKSSVLKRLSFNSKNEVWIPNLTHRRIIMKIKSKESKTKRLNKDNYSLSESQLSSVDSVSNMNALFEGKKHISSCREAERPKQQKKSVPIKTNNENLEEETLIKDLENKQTNCVKDMLIVNGHQRARSTLVDYISRNCDEKIDYDKFLVNFTYKCLNKRNKIMKLIGQKVLKPSYTGKHKVAKSSNLNKDIDKVKCKKNYYNQRNSVI